MHTWTVMGRVWSAGPRAGRGRDDPKRDALPDRACRVDGAPLDWQGCVRCATSG